MKFYYKLKKSLIENTWAWIFAAAAIFLFYSRSVVDEKYDEVCLDFDGLYMEHLFPEEEGDTDGKFLEYYKQRNIYVNRILDDCQRHTSRFQNSDDDYE